MRTRWFGNRATGGKLDPTLRRLVEDVSGALDRLQPPAVARGSGSVDATASAVVLPHGAIPGCSLVLQVSEASSSVGCWWSRGSDPHTGPVTLELFAELPLGPDRAGGVLAWLERELRRPVVERVRSFGVVRRREWLVVLDDDLSSRCTASGWRVGGGRTTKRVPPAPTGSPSAGCSAWPSWRRFWPGPFAAAGGGWAGCRRPGC